MMEDHALRCFQDNVHIVRQSAHVLTQSALVKVLKFSSWCYLWDHPCMKIDCILLSLTEYDVNFNKKHKQTCKNLCISWLGSVQKGFTCEYLPLISIYCEHQEHYKIYSQVFTIHQ